MGPFEALGIVIVVVGVLVARAWEWSSGPDKGTPKAIRAAYTRGEIDERELERRLDVAMDPEADRIRATVEQVSGIGPATSWTIAAEFQSIEELRNADRDDLEAVANVGPERADALDEL